MTTFDEQLSVFVAEIQENVNNYYQQTYPNLKPGTINIEPGGRRFVKISKGDATGKSVFCFVERATGDVYKAESWKAPAKGVRGNIVNPAKESCSVYGANYAK